jgi:hypothetical protein
MPDLYGSLPYWLQLLVGLLDFGFHLFWMGVLLWWVFLACRSPWADLDGNCD